MSQSWVKWFLSTPRGKYFVQIDDEYLQNIYNYYGLRQKVPNFKYALDLIRGPFIPPQNRPAAWPDDIDDYGLCLYGLIHARYLLTECLKNLKTTNFHIVQEFFAKELQASLMALVMI